MAESQRIKVCQVLNAYRVGGAETVALDLARSLDPDRFESLAVALIEPRDQREPEMRRRFREAGVAAYALHGRSFRDPRTLWRIVRFLRQHRPQVVHGHNRFADLWAGRLAPLAGVGAVLWTRHSVYKDMQRRHRSSYQRLARRAVAVVAVSDAVHRYCLEVERLPAAKVRTIPNGIDTERFRPATATERQDARARLGVAGDEHVLLFVGRLSEQKGPDAFVALVRRLRQRGLRVRGFVCGHGELAARMQALVAGESGVELLGLRQDVPTLLGACDLFVSTSRNEGLPLNVMEAMAAGAPITAPDLAQIEQLVAGHRELESGLYPRPPEHGQVPAGQIDAWADVVAARLADPDLRHRCGAAGRAVITERFPLTRMVEEYAAIYESISAGRLVGPRG
ncbi:MAG TPA: glycosyltransferase [Candidatus Krumholzibacteria bacterium]|nr:glycosyltransferase [Candidatus Krumholzibacteria bacterium]HPD70786.1 glycosyltransferase [Candidatus Krumholzibacteria bacterium]HRY39514.1 glycosyltransferase [Candidatus Krumholzibacteria bacterium]